MRRMVCRAPWSAVAVTEQVFTTTRSAACGGRRTRARREQLFLEAERIGLVHAAAERDRRSTSSQTSIEFQMSSAFRPMSCRYCMPSNEIWSTPA